MLENKLTNVYLIEILQEMCKRVNADYSKVDFMFPGWYLEFSWNKEEEKEFEKWLENYFKNNKKAFKSLYKFPLNNKHFRKEAAGWFLLSYGWKHAE